MKMTKKNEVKKMTMKNEVKFITTEMAVRKYLKGFGLKSVK